MLLTRCKSIYDLRITIFASLNFEPETRNQKLQTAKRRTLETFKLLNLELLNFELETL